MNIVARMVLHDWQRGRLPFYTLPPEGALEPTAAASPVSAQTATGAPGHEQAKAKKADGKKTRVLQPVEQFLNKIRVVAGFDAADMKGDGTDVLEPVPLGE